MQSETYATELFLPGIWLLYPASFFLVKRVTGLSIQEKLELKLSGEDADIVSKSVKVVNSHSTLKDVVFLLPLAPPAKYESSHHL